MGWINHEDGSTSFEVNLQGNNHSDKTTEKKFSGKIKGINIPISFDTKNHKTKKRYELCGYFSASQNIENNSKDIQRTLKFIYKYGDIAPNTHLIPMGLNKIEKHESFMGIDLSKLKFSISDDEFPATATLSEKMDFFPCYGSVLAMMLEYFKYPDFYISLLHENVFFNFKISSKSYKKISMQNINANCNDGFGHSNIKILNDSKYRISSFSQIDWNKLEFEEY